MRTKTTELLRNAAEGRYAVGAFAAHTLEELSGIIGAAEEEKSPAMLIIGSWLFGRADVELLVRTAQFMMQRTRVPISLHLDHGRTPEHIAGAIRYGYDSGMLDASDLPFEQNVEKTRAAAESLHKAGMACEGELGKIGAGVSSREGFTEPEEARRFVEETDVDALAVAVGTAHGLYPKPPKLDFDRLERIHAKCPAYLVLHGGSDTPPDQVRRAIELGITKINIATDVTLAYIRGISGAKWSLEASLGATNAVKALVKEKMQILGSSGRAVGL